MANTREGEIVDSLRSQGYTSNQIIGAIRQHRHNIKVAAEQARREAEYEKRKQEWEAEQEIETKKLKEDYYKQLETKTIGDIHDEEKVGEKDYTSIEKQKLAEAEGKSVDEMDFSYEFGDFEIRDNVWYYKETNKKVSDDDFGEGVLKKLGIIQNKVVKETKVGVTDLFDITVIDGEVFTDASYEKQSASITRAVKGDTRSDEERLKDITELVRTQQSTKLMEELKYDVNEYLDIEFRPILNEETKKLEWNYLNADGEYIKLDKNNHNTVIAKLNATHGDALNIDKYTDFKIVEGKWNRVTTETQDGEDVEVYSVVEEEGTQHSLTELYPNAVKNAKKQEDGISKKAKTLNLIDVKRAEHKEVADEEYRDRLATSRLEYFKTHIAPKFNTTANAWNTNVVKMTQIQIENAKLARKYYNIEGTKLVLNEDAVQAEYSAWINEAKMDSLKYQQFAGDSHFTVDAYISNTSVLDPVSEIKINEKEALELGEDVAEGTYNLINGEWYFGIRKVEDPKIKDHLNSKAKPSLENITYGLDEFNITKLNVGLHEDYGMAHKGGYIISPNEVKRLNSLGINVDQDDYWIDESEYQELMKQSKEKKLSMDIEDIEQYHSDKQQGEIKISDLVLISEKEGFNKSKDL